MSYNQIYPGFADSLYRFCNINYCNNTFVHVFAWIQSSIMNLRVFSQYQKVMLWMREISLLQMRIINASILGNFWPQLLHRIWHAVFAVNVKPPDSTPQCSATFQPRVGRPFILSCHQASFDKKLEDQWWSDMRAWNDWKTVPGVAIINACLCRS